MNIIITPLKIYTALGRLHKVPPKGAQPLQSALAQPLQSSLAQPLSPLRGDEIFKGVKGVKNGNIY
jgi:hypothetical protein